MLTLIIITILWILSLALAIGTIYEQHKANKIAENIRCQMQWDSVQNRINKK